MRKTGFGKALALAVLLPGLAAAAEPPRDVQDLVFLGETRPVRVRMDVRVNGKSFMAAWDNFMASMFENLDTDKDGSLSRAEAEKALAPQALFTSGFPGNSFPVAAMAVLDADKDGKVTADELKRYYRANGAAPFQLQLGQSQPFQQDVLILADGRNNRTAPPAEALNNAFFSLLDTDKDGKLSKEELARTPEAFLKMDEDDDEVVQIRELAPNVASPNDRFVRAQLAEASARRPATNTGSVALIQPGEPGTVLARRLQERYGPKNVKPGDKKLTQKDLGLDDETFASLDADGDGSLDTEELARFGRGGPDLEVIIRLGQKTDKEGRVELVTPRGKPSPLAAKIRTAKDGSLAVDLGVVQLSLRGPADEGARATLPANALRQRYLMLFKQADMDNNGYLEEKEVQQTPLRSIFKALDADNDGKVFEKEFVAYLDRVTAAQAKAMASCVTLNVSDGGRGLFELLDADNDNRLSVREMRQAAAKLLEALDRDGDGMIARNEIPRNHQLQMRLGPAGGGGFDGVVRVARTLGGPAPQPPAPTGGPVWFRKMDRNRDSDVSRREFLGTDEEFRRIDADGDGLISRAEAERFDADQRKTTAGR